MRRHGPVIAHCTDSRKSSESVQCAITAHTSQAFSITPCTDSEDLPSFADIVRHGLMWSDVVISHTHLTTDSLNRLHGMTAQTARHLDL